MVRQSARLAASDAALPDSVLRQVVMKAFGAGIWHAGCFSFAGKPVS
jgi:hypothetical protein